MMSGNLGIPNSGAMPGYMSNPMAGRMGTAAGVGSLGAGLAQMFLGGHNKNPYDEASKYYNKIPGTISPYFNPYISAGHEALNSTQGQYGNLINDPGSIMSKFGAGYQQSPGYDWARNQAMEGINNAAAAGGMAGSPQHQQQAGEMSANLANQDYYNYLNHVLGLYQGGLSGMGHINDQGYNASNELAGGLSSSLMNQGNAAFSGTQAANKQKADEYGDIFGGIGSLAAFLPMLM